MKWEGVFVPLLSPLKKSGEIDFALFDTYLDYLLSFPIKGVMILGTSGEFHTFTFKERIDYAEFVKNKIGNTKQIIVNCSSNSIKEVQSLIEHAESLNVDSIALTTPNSNIFTLDNLVEYFKEIFNLTNMPKILYNTYNSLNEITPELVHKLKQFKRGLVGIKDASDDTLHLSKMIYECGNEIAVLIGIDDLFLPMLLIGAKGGIIPSANIIPDYMIKIWQYFKEQKIKEASSLNKKVFPIFEAIELPLTNFPNSVKYILSLKNINLGYYKPPNLEINNELKLKLKERISACELYQEIFE